MAPLQLTPSSRMKVSGIRELYVLLVSNRFIYRIPITHDKVGKLISINKCKNWLEIEVEVREEKKGKEEIKEFDEISKLF